MSLHVMAIILFAAALHASWNAMVCAASEKFQDTVLIILGAGVWTALLLPLVPVPAAESWPYLAGSVVIHVAYFSLVAFSYRSGELSFTYALGNDARTYSPCCGTPGDIGGICGDHCDLFPEGANYPLEVCIDIYCERRRHCNKAILMSANF